jgi:hypothetical protein
VAVIQRAGDLVGFPGEVKLKLNRVELAPIEKGAAREGEPDVSIVPDRGLEEVAMDPEKISPNDGEAA